MKKQKIIFQYSVLLVIFFTCTAIGKPLVEKRLWQFHTLNMDYVLGVMKKAPDYGINTVVFSHDMIEQVTQLYNTDDDGKLVLNQRAAQLRKLAQDAHDLGLMNYIWIHEIENVPKKFLKEGKVQYDTDNFIKFLTNKYEKLFHDCPEFDGILLTFHETKYKIFDNNQVDSKLSMSDRFAQLVNTLDLVCARNKKDLIVRTFLYEPIELAWIQEGLRKVDSRVMIQSKCVPHDWQPFYPHNPAIGVFPNHKQIIEFDGSSEFTGRNYIPYTCPEYFEYHWRYDLTQQGVSGYNIRLDHGGYDAFYTLNEINIYAMYRLTEDPDITSAKIWEEWTVKHYGKEAVPFIPNALKPSFECVNKALFVQKYWYTKHSELPSFEYANLTISRRSTAKWHPDKAKELKKIENLLNHPTPEYLEVILAEKDEAIALADESILNLQLARPLLKYNQYSNLQYRLNLLKRVAIIWKLHAEAFWGYKTLQEGHDVPGLKERVHRCINGLKRQAGVSPKKSHNILISSENIKSVAEDLEERLNQLK